jgi:hypothetical protein
MRLTRLRPLAAEDGFTLVSVLGVLGVVLILSVAAFAATDGDLRPSAVDRERKQAYAAAEAGINDYLARLVARPEYWTQCATPGDGPNPSHPGLQQRGQVPRRWATIDGSQAQYSIELLPANGAAQCDPNDPVGTFIDADTGTFRIRSTGRASPASTVHRSIIATFRRRGFLDYIYFTDLETSDPTWYRVTAGNQPTRENGRGNGADARDVVRWGNQECGYWRDGRGSKRFRGDPDNDDYPAGRLIPGGSITRRNDWRTWTQSCGEIQFVGNSSTYDQVNGPLHTNDELLICGSPKFGRRPSDDIEVSGPGEGRSGPGYRANNGCSANPIVNLPGEPVHDDRGTFRRNAPLVTLPPTNRTLEDDALPTYRFMGRTTIVLSGESMHVTGRRANGTPIDATIPMPKDGVIWIGNDPSGTCPGYDPVNPYAAPATCGDVWLRGSYARSLTIAAENDIVIQGSVRASGNARPLLGLISNNFIRVYHPVKNLQRNDQYGTYSCQNDNPPGEIWIDAAILSLNHSFTVDHYYCGSALGQLHVYGAIAQKYRGPVGTGSGGSPSTGYIKDYTYNDDLRFRSPPRFLDPIQTTWRLLSAVEQVPPAR